MIILSVERSALLTATMFEYEAHLLIKQMQIIHRIAWILFCH